MSLEASSILSYSAVSPMTLAALRKSRVISSKREMHLHSLLQPGAMMAVPAMLAA